MPYEAVQAEDSGGVPDVRCPAFRVVDGGGGCGMTEPQVQERERARYRTVVADPPWPYDERPTQHQRSNGESFLPYPTMTLYEIAGLPVEPLIDKDKWHVGGAWGGCNLFLWTTARFIGEAHDIVRAWGFVPNGILVWCKPPGGPGLGGVFSANVEFVVMGKRGRPKTTERVPTRWFEWPRGRHSVKPDAFYDLVERVSPAPRLEMFARRARFGWDYWGDQSLGTAEMVA